MKIITADQVRASLKLSDLIEPMRNAFKATRLASCDPTVARFTSRVVSWRAAKSLL
jgi:hypothetical protein